VKINKRGVAETNATIIMQNAIIRYAVLALKCTTNGLTDLGRGK